MTIIVLGPVPTSWQARLCADLERLAALPRRFIDANVVTARGSGLRRIGNRAPPDLGHASWSDFRGENTEVPHATPPRSPHGLPLGGRVTQHLRRAALLTEPRRPAPIGRYGQCQCT
ncbi:hypothetical protein HUJ04_000293 [Dendroctonus ponderosae]|nr:hypothetical protein HUJ04_000293 [Dendroctonus ponderosae]